MSRLFTSLALLIGLTSCTILRPEGVVVRGSVWLVPPQEVRSAITQARAGTGNLSKPVYGVIVSSSSEIYVYFDAGVVVGDDIGYVAECAVVRKANGRWRYVGMASSPGI